MKATTVKTTFKPRHTVGEPMYSIEAGHSVRDVLMNANTLLVHARAIAEQLPFVEGLAGEELAYAIGDLVEMARASVEACVMGLGEETG